MQQGRRSQGGAEAPIDQSIGSCECWRHLAAPREHEVILRPAWADMGKKRAPPTACGSLTGERAAGCCSRARMLARKPKSTSRFRVSKGRFYELASDSRESSECCRPADKTDELDGASALCEN